jgi:hypothetical protein
MHGERGAEAAIVSNTKNAPRIVDLFFGIPVLELAA